MKKFIYSLIAMLFMSVTMISAQTHVICGGVGDNWFVGANVGVSAPQTHAFDFANHSSWVQLYRPNVGLEIGKELTPYTSLSISDDIHINTTRAKTMIDENYVFGNVKFNLSSLLFGFYAPRKWDVTVGPSIGWVKYLGLNDIVSHTNFVAYRGSASVNYHFGSANQWSVSLTPNWTCVDRLCAHNSRVGLNLGVTYKIKGVKSKTHGMKVCDLVCTPDEYDNMVDEMDALKQHNAYLHGALDECNQRVSQVDTIVMHDTVVQQNFIPSAFTFQHLNRPMFIFFDKGSSTVNRDMVEIIKNFTHVLHTHPTSNVTVIGFADKSTGTSDVNLKISEERAKSVAKILETEGIARKRIKVVAKGDTDQPFDETDKNRLVVLKFD